MAYRRRPKSATFEDFRLFPEEPPPSPAARRRSSLSYGRSASSVAALGDLDSRRHTQDSNAHDYTQMKSLNESKYGFWGVLRRKAKTFIEDEKASKKNEAHYIQPQKLDSMDSQLQSHWSSKSDQRIEIPISHKGSGAIASSRKEIGDTTKNSFEEGQTIVENKTADIIQEKGKLQIRRKPVISDSTNKSTETPVPTNLSHNQADYEFQLKASHNVANSMSAKAKLLLRELETVKADLAFAKERCAQLEEENKTLRENHQKGDIPADDFLIRLQLETLLDEKAKLAHENSIYARENLFLREIVEYHQLTMQDIVYLNQGVGGIEEESEGYPIDHQIATFSSALLHAVPKESSSPVLSSPPSTTPDPTLSSPEMVEPGSPTSPTSLNIVADTLHLDAESSPQSPTTESPMQQHSNPP